MSTLMSTDMNLTRPTSRVLRPPGGGSSNIFGTDEPAPADANRGKRRTPAQEEAPLAAVPVSRVSRQQNNNVSNVTSAPTPAPAPAAGSRARQPPGGQSSIVFG